MDVQKEERQTETRESEEKRRNNILCCAVCAFNLDKSCFECYFFPFGLFNAQCTFIQNTLVRRRCRRRRTNQVRRAKAYKSIGFTSRLCVFFVNERNERNERKNEWTEEKEIRKLFETIRRLIFEWIKRIYVLATVHTHTEHTEYTRACLHRGKWYILPRYIPNDTYAMTI